MEKTKLTVRVPRDLLEGAKRYAREQDTTLTRLVSEYLRRLGVQDELPEDATVVRRLSGTLAPAASKEDYGQYLDEKHLG